MPVRLFVLLAVLLAAPVHAQGVASGVVTDAATGEVLIGASVYAPALGAGAATNAYGFFSLPLPADSVRLRVSYVGYVARDTVVDARADVQLDVALAAEGTLGEVVVEGDGVGARPEATPQMGHTALSGRDVQGLPAILGEADVLKAIQLLPGVRGGAEGTAGIYVRRGCCSRGRSCPTRRRSWSPDGGPTSTCSPGRSSRRPTARRRRMGTRPSTPGPISTTSTPRSTGGRPTATAST